MNYRLLAVAVVAFLACGCKTQVPPKYEVTDLGTNQRFTTYGDIGQETLFGYTFRDIESGDRLMLRTYRVRVLSAGGQFDPKSQEARQWEDDKARAFGLAPSASQQSGSAPQPAARTPAQQSSGDRLPPRRN